LDASNSPILPPDFDPLAPNQEPFAGPTEPDHVPALESAFRPPPVAVIPDDWDVDPPAAARPQPPPQAPRPPQAPKPHEVAAPAPPKQAPAPPPDAVHDSRLAQPSCDVGLSDTTLPDPENAGAHRSPCGDP
jgi:hypothetical protein